MQNLTKFFKSLNPQFFIWLFGVIVLLALALDAYSNPDTFSQYLGFSANNFLVLAMFIFILTRFLFGNNRYSLVSKNHQTFWAIMAIAFAILATGFSLLDRFTYTNFVFEHFRLHQSGFFYAHFFSLFIFLVFQPYQFLLQHKKSIIALLPFWGIYWMFIAWTWPFDIFINSTKEDHLIEWLQFFVLFIGSIISFRLALKKYFQNQKYHAFWFLLWSLMFFLVAGDEISWGIRLLGLEVPELVAQQNRQDDFTFHNLFVFEWIVFWGYLSIAFFGFFSRQICSIGKSFSALLKFFHPYTPSYYLLGYWLLPLIFWGYHLFAVIGIWRFWSEPAELFIYAGLVLWILDDRPVS